MVRLHCCQGELIVIRDLMRTLIAHGISSPMQECNKHRYCSKYFTKCTTQIVLQEGSVNDYATLWPNLKQVISWFLMVLSMILTFLLRPAAIKVS